MMKTIQTSILTVAMICVSSISVRAQNNVPAGNTANGKQLFIKVGCFACHGTVGHGGAGARLAPNPLPAAAFINYVRKGGQRGGAGMPAYSTVNISDAELADIRAYLASIPAPPPAKSIPLLND